MEAPAAESYATLLRTLRAFLPGLARCAMLGTPVLFYPQLCELSISPMYTPARYCVGQGSVVGGV